LAPSPDRPEKYRVIVGNKYGHLVHGGLFNTLNFDTDASPFATRRFDDEPVAVGFGHFLPV